MIAQYEKTHTKDRLMDAAKDLMLAKGYAATTVDDICAKAEVTKGCFFHYFQSKEDLAKSLLTRHCDAHQKTKEEMFGPDPLDQVFGQIDMAIASSKKPGGAKGCLKGTLAHELSDTHPEIRDICSTAFKQMADDFAQDLKKAKTKYAPKAAFDPHMVASHMIAVWQGALILAKTHQDKTIVAEHLGQFKAYVQFLFRTSTNTST